MSVARRKRRIVAQSVRAAVSRAAVSRCFEPLEGRVLLASALYEPAASVLYGAQPGAPMQPTLVQATATATPIEMSGDDDGGGAVTPNIVNGIVYSNLNSGSGYFTAGAATGLLGMDDYDSINDANINLTSFKFIGGVSTAGMTLQFEFYNASDVFVTGFTSTLSQGGVFQWTIGPIAGVTIPDAGRLRIVAQAGSTGEWWFSNAAPTTGTQSGAIGSAPAGSSYKFEYTNNTPNSAPVIASLSDTPDPATAGGALTLTANGVNDVDGNLSSVAFYRESNGIVGLQTATDTLVGTDNTGPTYSVNITAPANGSYKYYAQATDAVAAVSNIVTTTNNVGVGSITGTVWNDVNNSKTIDGGETGLQNWTVFLDTDQDQVLDGGETSTTTNASGGYTFSNLAPGNYWVTTVIPGGWTQTFPGNVGQINAVVMGTVSAEAVSPAQALPAGVTTTGSNAPVYLPDGSNPAGGATPFSLPNVFTDDVESNPLIRLTNFQADPRFNTIRGQGQSVVVIDTGIDVDSTAFGPDLVAPFGISDRIVYQQDFANGDFDATDFNGHGSNVASIVGSQNGAFPGMAPDVGIIALKVFTDAGGGGTFAMIEAALQWVVANAANYNIAAINMSLGNSANYNTDQALFGISDELAALAAANVIVVSSAGNSYGAFQAEGVGYPAADANSLGVGAVYDADHGPRNWQDGASDFTSGPDRITSFSQRSGIHTEIFAPGAFIMGANQSGGTNNFPGTSQAAPHIAGIAALAQQLAQDELGRKLTMTEYKNLLQSSGVSIVDGDDENDNVVNTGLTFKRVDVLSLGEAIRALATKPRTHTVKLSPGENATNINFGNKTNDVTAPTADIVDVTPDPRTTATGLVTINFNENVTGVDKNDFTLTRDGASVSLTAATFAAVNAAQYTLDLTNVTSQAGQYVLSLPSGGANNIEDTSGNDYVTPASDTWLKTAVDGTGANDTITLVRSSAVINVTVSGSATYSVNIVNLGANVLSVLGGAGNDSIVIDFTGGAPAPTNGLSVDGGAHTTGDTLTLTGTTSAESATFTTTNFNFGATTIGYTNVESHVYNGGATGIDTLNVNGGVFTFANDASVGTANLNVVVGAAGTVHFNTTQHLNNLTIAGNADMTAGGGSKLLVTKGLSITGKLDLRTHDLILNYSGGSPIGSAADGVYTAGSVQRMVQLGANGGAWNGNGLMTSEAAAATGLTGLGAIEASTLLGAGGGTYGGTESVDATSIIVKYTYAGDANLDGFISGDDYTSIDFNIATPGSNSWFNGDFNWDGIISGDDYTAIDFNIVAQGGPL